MAKILYVVVKQICKIKSSNRLLELSAVWEKDPALQFSENEIVTNFHVIADEPSPKVIFPDGSFAVPVEIVGDKDKDLAVLKIDRQLFKLNYSPLLASGIKFGEPIYAAGYPLGSELPGKVTVKRDISPTVNI